MSVLIVCVTVRGGGFIVAFRSAVVIILDILLNNILRTFVQLVRLSAHKQVLFTTLSIVLPTELFP